MLLSAARRILWNLVWEGSQLGPVDMRKSDSKKNQGDREWTVPRSKLYSVGLYFDRKL